MKEVLSKKSRCTDSMKETKRKEFRNTRGSPDSKENREKQKRCMEKGLSKREILRSRNRSISPARRIIMGKKLPIHLL